MRGVANAFTQYLFITCLACCIYYIFKHHQASTFEILTVKISKMFVFEKRRNIFQQFQGLVSCGSRFAVCYELTNSCHLVIIERVLQNEIK